MAACEVVGIGLLDFGLMVLEFNSSFGVFGACWCEGMDF